MKLLILAFLAVVVLAAAGSHATRDDCFWQWRTEAREQAREVREQARELRRQQREQMRAFREQAREERDRIRREIREDMRRSYTY
jgi:Spy/CpxP family protein refolding chaperone